MAGASQLGHLEETFERIEETILPTLSMMLEAMMEVAERGQPASDFDNCSAELRTVALQLEALTKEVEAISPAHIHPKGYGLPSAL